MEPVPLATAPYGRLIGMSAAFATSNFARMAISFATSLVVAYDADFDLDGDVDAADLTIWRSNAGLAASALHSQGDADADGDVDGADILRWQRQLGSGLPVVGADGTVPEPTALVAWLLGAAVLMWARPFAVRPAAARYAEPSRASNSKDRSPFARRTGGDE